MPELPASLALLDVVQGSIVTQAIYVAAELKIAEALHAKPLSAAEIAEAVGAAPDATHRLLRLLASYSIFTERSDGRFAMTPMADALRADAPNSLRSLAVLMGYHKHWEEWAHLVESVRTGEPSLPKLRGMSAFEHLQADPEYGAVFMGGMANLSDLETGPILTAYDFSGFKTLVDVGGGRGGLLAAILRQATETRGILFDARAAEAGAAEFLAAQGVADRCVIERGGLFDPIPEGADAYMLKHIVHDWPEAKVLEILKNVRDAISDDGRLLLMEFVPPSADERHPAKWVDLWLMLLVGGKERTSEQYADILSAAGFQLERVTPTAAPISIIQARPR